MSDLTPEERQIEALRLELDALGIEYHHKHGVDKLRTLLLEAQAAAPEESVAPATLQEDPLELIRVVVYSNDPNKREYTGDYFTSGNEVIGIHTKYIPFANEEGWHVPRVLLNMMKEQTVQLFKKVKDPRTGMETSEGYIVPAYNIKELPNLTKKELETLAKQQARANAID